MSFVGKTLIVVQLVLSFLFMGLAGAVFSAHTNWKKKFDDQVKATATARSEAQTAQTNLEKAKTDLELAYKNEYDARLRAEDTVSALTTQVAALGKDRNDLQSQVQTQTGIAETRSAEAGYRDEEARKQRIINADLQRRLDESVIAARNLEDELFTVRADMSELQRRHDDLLFAKSFLEKVVAKAGLNTDPRIVAGLQQPAPNVQGVVREVHKDNRDRPYLISVTVGGDEGLLKGHELDVYRTGDDGRKAQWLGKVKVVNTHPDEAECEVLDTSKNGLIEVGDNVTTKL